MNQVEIIQAPGDALLGAEGKEAAAPLPEKALKQEEQHGKWKVVGRGTAFPLVLLIVWQICGSLGLISATLLPTPADIAIAFYDLLISGDLFRHLGVSVWRAAVGFVLGGSIGLVAGISVGLFRRLEQSVDPSIQMLRTVPHLAITPLFILWFGFGEFSKILLIALGAFFPLYIQTFQGIRGVDAKLFDVARVLEFSRIKQVTRLVLPAALPNILLGLRLSLGVSWLGLVVAELMGSSEGIGYLIMDARQFAQTAIVFVGITIFAVVGKATDSFVRYLEKRLLRWRDSFGG